MSSIPNQPYNNLIIFSKISLEGLNLIDGDVIFVATQSNDEQAFLEELKQKPLWQTLRAVQQDQVYPIDYMTWKGQNLLAADAVIDDLYKYLVDTPAASANP